MTAIKFIYEPNLSGVKEHNADIVYESRAAGCLWFSPGAAMCVGRVIGQGFIEKCEYSMDQEISDRAPPTAAVLVASNAHKFRYRLERSGQLTVVFGTFDLGAISLAFEIIASMTRLAGDKDLVRTEVAKEFWGLVGESHLWGPASNLDHQVTDAGRRLDAAMAWFIDLPAAQATRQAREAMDVTELVTKIAPPAIKAILAGDPDMLMRGDKLAMDQSTAAQASFVSEYNGGDVVVRISPRFVNHLYGPRARAIVAFNQVRGSITVSLAHPIPYVNLSGLLFETFPSAGVHVGNSVIATTPPDVRMTLENVVTAARAVEGILEYENYKRKFSVHGNKSVIDAMASMTTEFDSGMDWRNMRVTEDMCKQASQAHKRLFETNGGWK